MFIVARTLLTQSVRTIFGGAGLVAALSWSNPNFWEQFKSFFNAAVSGDPIVRNSVEMVSAWNVGMITQPIVVGLVPFIFGIFSIYTTRSFIHKVRQKESYVVFLFRTLANFFATLFGALPGFLIGKTLGGIAAVQWGTTRFDTDLVLRNYNLANAEEFLSSDPENAFSFSRLMELYTQIDFRAGTEFLITKIGEIEFLGYDAIIRGDLNSDNFWFMVLIWVAAVILGVLGFYLIRGIIYGVFNIFTFPFRGRRAQPAEL